MRQAHRWFGAVVKMARITGICSLQRANVVCPADTAGRENLAPGGLARQFRP